MKKTKSQLKLYIFEKYVNETTKRFYNQARSFNFIKKNDYNIIIELNLMNPTANEFYMLLHTFLFLNNKYPTCPICNNQHKNFSNSFGGGFKICCSLKCRKILANKNSTNTQLKKNIYKKTSEKNKIIYSNKTSEEKSLIVAKRKLSMSICKNGFTGFEQVSNALKNKTKKERKSIYKKQQKTRFSKSQYEIDIINKKTSETLKNKSINEKKRIYTQQKKTCVKRGLWKDTSDKTNLELYYEKVKYFTNRSYYISYKIINPNNFKRERFGYHLDHKFSKLEGYRQNIPPYIIGSPANLELLWWKKNNAKRTKCSITKEELFGSYNTLKVQ